jgi:hypothetical protein
MVSTHVCRCKGGGGKIPPEWTVETALLLALLKRSPRTWPELFQAGFTVTDLASAVIELIAVGHYGFFVGARGICLDREAERGCNGGPEKAA